MTKQIAGERSWTDVDHWRKDLHKDFELALTETKLPESPDYEAANRFLIKARQAMVKQLSLTSDLASVSGHCGDV